MNIFFILLLVLWLGGIFILHYGPIIHVLLLLATLVVMFKTLQWVKNK